MTNYLVIIILSLTNHQGRLFLNGICLRVSRCRTTLFPFFIFFLIAFKDSYVAIKSMFRCVFMDKYLRLNKSYFDKSLSGASSGVSSSSSDDEDEEELPLLFLRLHQRGYQSDQRC